MNGRSSVGDSEMMKEEEDQEEKEEQQQQGHFALRTPEAQKCHFWVTSIGGGGGGKFSLPF